ncbi:MAG: acetyltransferase, partial [Pseudomonadota bacterium]
LFSVTAPTAIVGENVEIGPGFVLSDFSMLTTDLRVGQGFHANMYAYVAHDCVVGDFVTLAPRASVNGRVVIEDDVYIGAGATILQGKPGKPITIGRGAVVGAHALVTRDVAPGTTVVGVPAKPLERGA